jgi:hypothetical protein
MLKKLEMRDWLIMNNMGRLLKEGIYSLNCCYGLRLWKIKGEGKLSWYSEMLLAEQLGFDSRQGHEIFLFSVSSRLVLGPSQSSLKWLLGVPFLTVKWLGGLKLICHLHVVLGSALLPLLHTYSRYDAQLIRRRDRFSLYLMQFRSFWDTTVT